MLSTWIDAHSPSHLALYGLAGGLSEYQADQVLMPWHQIITRIRQELPRMRPRTATGAPTVVYSSLPVTPHHWVLYAFAAQLTADQAHLARTAILDLVERVERGEDVTKPERRRRPAKAIKARTVVRTRSTVRKGGAR